MKSVSPYSDIFEYTIAVDKENKKIDDFIESTDRKTVVVQGLGFVGSAMVAILANARYKEGTLSYNVIGLDLADEDNYWKIGTINKGKPPFTSTDLNLERFYENGYKNGNLMATYSLYAYSKADVVVVDIHLDIKKKQIGQPFDYVFSYDEYKKALLDIADNINEDALVMIETTVPAGTTEKIIYPLFRDAFRKRGLNINRLYIAYSYERVLPGPNYINSITNFYRVYSGINETAKIKVREFLESFINTKDFPLYEISSTTTAEIAKVLENSYSR